MIFITDNNTLKAYIPNVIKEASGEREYFDKIMPWIQHAEDWLIREIFGPYFVIPDRYLNRGRSIIAFMALYNAIPSLDLVMTPNGIGVINSQNVVPASRERVERLRTSLLEQRDQVVDSLLAELADDPDWRKTSSGLAMDPFFFCPSNFHDGCSYEQYKANRSRAALHEGALRSEVVSPGLCDRIEKTLPSMWTAEEYFVVRQVRSFVREAITDQPRKYVLDEIVRQLVERLRKNPESYPEWHNSELCRLWSPEVFVNNKDYSGYWF